MGAPPDKRQRLVTAALDVFYRQGFGATSLAQVAEQADVPLGNVYYYFKSKGALLQAVLDCHLDELRQIIAEADKQTSPGRRLLALLKLFAQGADTRARFGCPVGSLAQELEKEGGDYGNAASRPFELQRHWVCQQFVDLGYAEQADDLALEILCNTQGAALVAHAMRQPEVMKQRFDAILKRAEQLIEGRDSDV